MIKLPMNGPMPIPRPTQPQGGMGHGYFPPAPMAPQQGGNRFMGFLGNNSDALMAMGAGLLSGRTGPEQFGLGMQGFAQARGAAKEKAESKKKKNATLDWLRQNAPEYADAVEQGILSAGDAYKMKLEAQKPKSGVSFGKSPVYGTDPETGEAILGVVGDDGSFKKLETDGFSPSTGIDKIDAGTHYILVDKRSGQQVGTAPKNNYEEAFDSSRGSEAGKAAGDAEGSYKSVASKLPGLEAVVERLGVLADKATYTYAGQGLDVGMRQLGMDPREAAVARTEYQAMVDNQVLPMLRDTFGAAFTVKEGETLRATLGDLNKSPTERKAILRAFIEQKRRDIEALGRQAGQQAPQSQGGVQSYTDYFGGN